MLFLHRAVPGLFRRAAAALLALALPALAAGAEFGTPGGPPPGNVEAVASVLRQDPYDLELMVSFGTSRGGSAGHLALAIRGEDGADDTVWSANFYADRDPGHAQRYNRDLMLAIPRTEYLWGTTSTLGDNASFGLDFGEAYKRSVIGVRVHGVPPQEKAALATYFRRINDDFHAQASWTAYQAGEVKYGYMDLNCAKTIASAFRWGAGYDRLPVSSAWPFGSVRVVAGLIANIPTEMAVKLMEEWNARGYAMDLVIYKKYPDSPWVDPLEEEKVAFRDLPNRFPSVLSRDFRREQGRYEDYDNLYAMYLFYNLGRASVVVDGATRELRIERTKDPMPYAEARERAAASARADADSYRKRLLFRPRGTPIEVPADNSHLYDYDKPSDRR